MVRLVTVRRMGDRRAVLVLSRNYPSPAQPLLGLWVERPTLALARRADVRVVAPVPWAPPLPDRPGLRHLRAFRAAPGHEQRQGVTVLRPRYLVGPGHRFFATERASMLASVWPVVRRLHARRPVELVHGHFAYPDGAVAAEVGRRLGVPVVVTEHAPWRPFMDGLPSYARQVLRSADHVDRYLPVSMSVRDTIVHFTHRPEQAQVVPNGADTELFVPTGETRDADEVLFVGMPRPVSKGLEVLLEAFRGVVARRPGTRLTIVGGATTRLVQEHLADLERTADGPGLRGHVTFTGPLPPPEVAARMARAALLVLPSHLESFGAVLVEALAAGTPVVSTRSGGPQDVVTPDVGRLVPVADPAALEDALLDVLAHPERYPAHRLRQHVLDRFTWDAVAEQVHEVYDELLAVRR